MLGKDHINISIAFLSAYFIPILFLDIGGNMLAVVSFAIAVFIGSLLPDSDCGGKATIYYRFPIVNEFMKKVVGKTVRFTFSYLISKKKIKVEHEVGDEHRGIMHAPVGVLLSSIILMTPIILFAAIFSLFNIFVVLAIFFGLLVGQFLHLFEDSCTVSGINWGFPFSTKELKGEIYTFRKDKDKKDIRPVVYSGIFYGLSIVLALLYTFNVISNLSVFIIYTLVILYHLVALLVIVKISQMNERVWLMKGETLAATRKHLTRGNKNIRRI